MFISYIIILLQTLSLEWAVFFFINNSQFINNLSYYIISSQFKKITYRENLYDVSTNL